MAAESYSFSPQFATIRSESPLAGMRPVASIQHTALSFKADEPFKIRSSGEELVGLGAIEGVNKGVGKALEGITTAYVSARERKDKKDKEILDRGAQLAIAHIRSKGNKTEEEKQYEEDLKTTRLNLLKKQLNKKDKEDNDEPIVYGDPDAPAGEDLDNLAPSGQGLYDIVNPDVYPNDGLEAEPIGWSLDNLTGSIGPTPQEVQNLWSKPLSELTAATPAGAGQAAQLAATQAGQIPVPSQDMSTDVQAQVRPLTPAYDLTAKYKGLVSPEQAQGLREQFYKATGEQMTGLGQPSLANMPTPVAQARKEAAPQAATQNLGSYLKTWADPEVAAKAQQKISEIMGSSYAPAEIEEITTKAGERGFKVKYPKKLTAKEIADLKKTEKEAGQSMPALSKEQITIYNTLAGNVQQNPLIKNAIDAYSSQEIISTSLDEENGFGDINAINAFQRMVDPGVAVREGDITLLQSAIPRLRRLGLSVANLVDGDRLTPEARQELRKLATKIAKTRAKLGETSIEDLRMTATDAGINPDRVVRQIKFKDNATENLTQQVQSKIKELQSYPANSEQRLKAASELNALRQQLTSSK
jgi:hypothetical protein